MIYKKAKYSKLYIDHGLSEEEVQMIHFTWRDIRYDEEYLNMTWVKFLNSIGMSFQKDRVPNWKIESKEKWLWAKLKYGI
jgi:hypothetical protein